jgi:uroporphyrinogen III methyltransferase/synthase
LRLPESPSKSFPGSRRRWHRAHSSAVVFLTGHENPDKPGGVVRWEDYARLGATLCVYMGVRNLPVIARRLCAGGMPSSTPAAIIHAATTDGHRQRLATLGTLAAVAAEERFEAPSMVIIGEVAAHAAQLGWFDSARRPLVAENSQ